MKIRTYKELGQQVADLAGYEIDFFNGDMENTAIHNLIDIAEVIESEIEEILKDEYEMVSMLFATDIIEREMQYHKPAVVSSYGIDVNKRMSVFLKTPKGCYHEIDSMVALSDHSVFIDLDAEIADDLERPIVSFDNKLSIAEFRYRSNSEYSDKESYSIDFNTPKFMIEDSGEVLLLTKIEPTALFGDEVIVFYFDNMFSPA